MESFGANYRLYKSEQPKQKAPVLRLAPFALRFLVSDERTGDGGSRCGSGTSIGSGSGRECWQAPEPDIVPERQTLDGFSVQAPSDVPSGVLLQLEIKKDGEAGFNRIGDPVGANGIVTVDGREPCTWYWVRWVQAS